jgi:hypothetical protein
LRPVREQLEHDRVIRLLQAKWRRRYQVGMNVGNEQLAAVGHANAPLYPDLVLASNERGHRVEGVVEVETGESVNNMEALAQWVPFSRLRAAFYLYIPNGSVDSARRLVADNNITVSEIWSYYLIGDQMRFTMVYKAPVAERSAARRRPAAGPRKAVTRRSAAKPSRKARSAERGGRARGAASRSKKTARSSGGRTQKRK